MSNIHNLSTEVLEKELRRRKLLENPVIHITGSSNVRDLTPSNFVYKLKIRITSECTGDIEMCCEEDILHNFPLDKKHIEDLDLILRNIRIQKHEEKNNKSKSSY